MRIPKTKRLTVIVSLLFGIFTSVSAIVIIYSHANWVEIASNEKYPTAIGLGVDYNIVAYIVLLVFVASITTQIAIVYRSISKPYGRLPNDVVFPVITFTVQLVIGYLGLLQLPLPANWTNIIGVPIYAGITAISHHVYLYLWERQSKLTKLKDSNKEDNTNVVKSLELEHETLQSSLNWIVSFSALFVIGGVVTVAFNPDEFVTINLQQVILRNIVLLALVAIFGMWFGIVMQLLGQMRKIREAIGEIEPARKQ